MLYRNLKTQRMNNGQSISSPIEGSIKTGDVGFAEAPPIHKKNLTR